MVSEWIAECAEDDPTIEVPWSDAATGLRWVDLRAEPYDIAEITEAEQFPVLTRALRSLNATRSPLLTSKCDAWTLDSEALDGLRLELDLDETASTDGVSGYIDLIWRDRGLFASAHQQQDRLDRLVRRVQRLEHPQAKAEFVLRPAFFHRENALEGYAVTLYVTAAGADADSAMREWELALEDVIATLRTREFEVARTSATID